MKLIKERIMKYMFYPPFTGRRTLFTRCFAQFVTTILSDIMLALCWGHGKKQPLPAETTINGHSGTMRFWCKTKFLCTAHRLAQRQNVRMEHPFNYANRIMHVCTSKSHHLQYPKYPKAQLSSLMGAVLQAVRSTYIYQSSPRYQHLNFG